jgi:nitroreductase
MSKRAIRELAELLDRALLPVARLAGWLSSAYYLLARRRFDREHRAVVAGRDAYWRARGELRRSDPLLRRNVHRLEKGLVMRPRNAVFAEDYVVETVEALGRSRDALDPAERRWAEDVLGAYFDAVADSPAIARARARYAELVSGAHSTARECAPQARERGIRSGVGFDDFYALCRQRRSVRWFLQQPVPLELVERAALAAAQAPSACNRQPFWFRYFGDPAEARQVTGIAMGTVGYADNVPALAVVVGDLSAFPDERDRHLIYVDGALAAMQFMLALETLGLASCPINWPDVERLERRMARRLGLPAHCRPVMLIAIGYPDPAGGVPHSAKKAPALLLKTDDDYS